LVVPLVFFSISRSKLPGYILPAIPAGSLLAAEYVRRHVDDEKPSRWLIIAHALISAAPIVPAIGIGYIVMQKGLPWSTLTLVAALIALVVAIGITVTVSSKLGWRALYFVTLIPVVLAVAALLGIGSPAVDETLSARPLAARLASMEITPIPLAVLDVRRETEYGLNFYRNQPIRRYERNEIPAGQHLLLTPQGARPLPPQFVGNRRVSYLGDFPPQHLAFYWVAAENAAH
jgi:hypothetical protein